MNLIHSAGLLPIYFGKSICEQTVRRYLDIDLDRIHVIIVRSTNVCLAAVRERARDGERTH